MALVWPVSREDLPVVVLVNVLTNPVVVLLHTLVSLYAPALAAAATPGLEALAVLTEGWFCARRSGMHRPWLFALTANLVSCAAGLLLS